MLLVVLVGKRECRAVVLPHWRCDTGKGKSWGEWDRDSREWTDKDCQNKGGRGIKRRDSSQRSQEVNGGKKVRLIVDKEEILEGEIRSMNRKSD